MIRALAGDDRGWLAGFARERWGSPLVVADGRAYRIDELPGFVALEAQRVVGLLTFLIEGDRCHVVSLDAVDQGRGIGSALLERVVDAAREAGCARVELITTNDNMRAMRFYQRRGFRLAALHAGALERSRELKPGIPLVGEHGIPLRDELLLVRAL
jgi:ribosomal protein S18 acetylase RimI-like enzyme